MIQFVAETGSTNADLIARIETGEPVREGDWLVAERQIAGRGRQGRTWFDGHGNFMGSTVVRTGPQDPPPQSLALVTGVAVYDAVSHFCPDNCSLMLKWPNDLLLQEAKLSGILLERVGDVVVAGIGMNLAIAPQLPDRATIALSALGPVPSPGEFASKLAQSLNAELERWRHYGLDPLIRRWLAVATPLGTNLCVHEPDGAILAGQFAGLDPHGSLLLRLANGETRAIHAGDVFMTDKD
ncbi:biotin--[acetyl-CoA-carboxylase] ligase [Altererythrobacter sp. GH1-8]|uniref:biotin--[acetyl-CoA-carboxylase] ligase n=1 Tax=Altererythrobacter sp. GH1-8 TaxID=3349333 RepID=UPI00374CBE5C